MMLVYVYILVCLSLSYGVSTTGSGKHCHTKPSLIRLSLSRMTTDYGTISNFLSNDPFFQRSNLFGVRLFSITVNKFE